MPLQWGTVLTLRVQQCECKKFVLMYSHMPWEVTIHHYHHLFLVPTNVSHKLGMCHHCYSAAIRVPLVHDVASRWYHIPPPIGKRLAIIRHYHTMVLRMPSYRIVPRQTCAHTVAPYPVERSSQTNLHCQ